jgi:hypothetical protein
VAEAVGCASQSSWARRRTSKTVRDLEDDEFTQICPSGIVVAGTTSFDHSILG